MLSESDCCDGKVGWGTDRGVFGSLMMERSIEEGDRFGVGCGCLDGQEEVVTCKATMVSRWVRLASVGTSSRRVAHLATIYTGLSLSVTRRCYVGRWGEVEKG